jgi:hypothetical protein
MLAYAILFAQPLDIVKATFLRRRTVPATRVPGRIRQRVRDRLTDRTPSPTNRGNVRYTQPRNASRRTNRKATQPTAAPGCSSDCDGRNSGKDTLHGRDIYDFGERARRSGAARSSRLVGADNYSDQTSDAGWTRRACISNGPVVRRTGTSRYRIRPAGPKLLAGATLRLIAPDSLGKLLPIRCCKRFR